MTLKEIWKLYKISKNWKIVNNKVSIPDSDLNKLDIRIDGEVLEDEYNPKDEKGEYLPAMTQEDYDKWQAQKSGWQKFYDKVLGNVDKE